MILAAFITFGLWLLWRRHCDRATADRLAILAAIDALGEARSFAILEQTRLILGRNVQGGTGGFYQLLDELEKDGEITTRFIRSSSGHATEMLIRRLP